MFPSRSVVAAALVLSAAAISQAHVITPVADLTGGAPHVSNFVSGADNFINPETWRVYTFQATAGDAIDVQIDRLTAQADPIAYVHFGNLAGADVPFETYASDLNSFGLSWVASGDDNVDDAFGGPFGDPRFGFIAPASGTYTLITHMFGNYEGNPGYSAQVRGSTVPAPGAMALFTAGAALIARRRRK